MKGLRWGRSLSASGPATPARPRGRPVVVVGPLPPPVHGASRVTQAVVDQLRARAADSAEITVDVVSTAGRVGGAATGGLRYHLSRLGAHVRAAARVVTARRRGRGVVYLGGAGGAGLWYQLGVVAVSRLCGMGIVFHHHAYSYLTDGPVPAMRAIVRLGGKDGVHVCLSPGMAADFRSTYPTRSSIVSVSNARFIGPSGSQRRHSATPYRLVHVSNLSVEKGSLRVVEAFEKLRAADVDVTLTLVGRAADEKVRTAIEDACARHDGRLDHVGPVDQARVRAVLNDSDLFVFPTSYRVEAQPMVLLEALAGGVPVLATARGAIPDLLPRDWLIGESETVADRISEMMAADWSALSADARDLFHRSESSGADLMEFLLAQSGRGAPGPRGAVRTAADRHEREVGPMGSETSPESSRDHEEPSMKVAAKDAVKRLIPLVNRATERVGVRLQPVHYYSEVPDRRALSSERASWARPITLSGVDWDLDEQLAWLEKVCNPYLHEVEGLDDWRSLGTDRGPGYGPIESLVLHCVVRHLAPSRILEVGSGVSTVISRRAADRNAADGRGQTAITCIEPYPREALLALPGVDVVARKAQDVEAEHFEQLESGDLLFIDSTHAVRTGSELARLYLEVIPRLAPGVVIHIHDIVLPYLYMPDVLESVFDWQETTLLAALLSGNSSLRVLAGEAALHHDRPAELGRILPDYRPRPVRDGLYVDSAGAGHFPSSIWLIRQ